MRGQETGGGASMERGLLVAVGVVMALFGALAFVHFGRELAAGGDGKISPAVYAGMIVFFGGLLAAGVWLALWAYRAQRAAEARGQTVTAYPDPPTSPAERERRVLRLAERERGRVTVPEVAAQCGLTLAEAKAELDRLVSEGAADLHVTAGGVLVYVFGGFLSDEEKARATDL